MKSGYIYILFLLLNLNGNSQNQNKKWYFGNYAALDFMNNPPTAITGSQLSINRGSASVADAAGNFLFYTDGSTVWNQANQVMANGTGLSLANGTRYQNALIVKQPGSASLYYVFSMAGASFPLKYAIVDMSLAAGMGSVTIKAAPLTNFAEAEKLTGTRHCNGTDYWIVTRAKFPRTFYSYLLSASGLNVVPVISALGNDTISTVGEMKISPNGKRIAHNISKSGVSIYKVAVQVQQCNRCSILAFASTFRLSST